MIRIFNQYISPKGTLLVILETLLIGLALVAGARLRFWDDQREFAYRVDAPEFAGQILVFVIVFQVCFHYCDLYNWSIVHRRTEQWISIWQSIGSGSLLLGGIYFIFPALLLGRGIYFISVALIPVFILANRSVLDKAWRAAAPRQNMLILGSRDLAESVARAFTERRDLDTRIVGFVGTQPAASAKLAGYPVLGLTASLQQIVRDHHVTRIVVALEDRRGAMPVHDLVKLKVQGIRVEDAQSVLASLSGRVWLQTVQPSWFVFSDGFHRSTWTLIAKRTLDLVCGIVGLVLSAPLMFLVAVAVRLESKGPAIYRQRRVGFQGRCFHVLKFRSMRVDAEAGNGAQWASKNDPRVTRIGGVLRKFRLDELPQFVNVVRGEMSFVGPRPERPEFVDCLCQEISFYDERHSVRPGLTGWAQVQFPYGSSIEDTRRKLEYDLFYLKNFSVLFDAAIILKTIRIVLQGQGGR